MTGKTRLLVKAAVEAAREGKSVLFITAGNEYELRKAVDTEACGDDEITKLVDVVHWRKIERGDCVGTKWMELFEDERVAGSRELAWERLKVSMKQ